jgi:hypothetical protein
MLSGLVLPEQTGGWPSTPRPVTTPVVESKKQVTDEGDPTADDQPSPTPKPKARSVQIPIASQVTSHDATLGRGVDIHCVVANASATNHL